MWRIAVDSRVLDVNSSYSYLLWCRDFAATSIVADVDGEAAGFVTAYRRPDRPDTLMVWQVAVGPEHRARGLATQMLDHLVGRMTPAVDHVETTITPDNRASIALFTSFAESRDARVECEPVFLESHFPDGHQTELLFRIGPLS